MMTMALTGEKKIYDNLKDLTQVVRDKLLKRAMKRTFAPMERTAKARVQKDLGTLADSIYTRITSKGAKGEACFGIMGPRRGVKIPIRLITRGEHKGMLLIAIPTRYAHLIEFGHEVVVNGKVVGTIAPHPFMRAAWDEFGGDVAVYTFADELQAGIAAEVVRFAISASHP